MQGHPTCYSLLQLPASHLVSVHLELKSCWAERKALSPLPGLLLATLTHDLCDMQEAQIEAILQEAEIDLLVLARYMQIFSADFCSRHAQHTINIHHSFLPAFEGAPSLLSVHAKMNV